MTEIMVNCSLSKLMFYGYNHRSYEFEISQNPCRAIIKKVFIEKINSKHHLNENICFWAKIERFKYRPELVGKIVEIKFNSFSQKGEIAVKENQPEE